MRQGDLVSFTVTVRSPDGAPADACCVNRLHWIILTNDLSREVHFHEFKPSLRVMTADFQKQIRLSGPQIWKALVVNGRGELWTSNIVQMSPVPV